LAANPANRRPPANGAPPPELEQRPAGRRLWLGRWVIIVSIIAFLGVYVAQLAAGSGMFFTVLVSAAAMGIVGVGATAIRQMILHAAAQERADDILQQAGRPRRSGSQASNEEAPGE
jgi:hypothetical protein